MKKSFEKYIPFVPLKLEDRRWPDRRVSKAPSGAPWICGRQPGPGGPHEPPGRSWSISTPWWISA